MKYSLTLAAAAALLSPASAVPTLPSSSARLLLGQPGRILVADYRGTDFTITLNQSVSGNPSWMLLGSDTSLYAVDENSESTRLYTLNLDGNTLEQKAEAKGSAGVVHLEMNKDKTRMVGSSYGTGKIDIWNTENNGLELIKTIESAGDLSPGQEIHHPHQAVNDPTGRFFVVLDLASDRIHVIDSKDDTWEIVSSDVLPKKCGPRHGAFYPPTGQATHYVVVCELANEVHLFQVSYTSWAIEFTEVQKLSTFGPDAVAPEGAAAGELVVSDNGRDVYVSNRVTGGATDSIAQYKVRHPVDDMVELEFLRLSSTNGVNPRMMSLSKDNNIMWAGNVKSGKGLVALRRGSTGKLEEKAVASLDMAKFGEEGFGPQFVQQIA